MMGVLAFIIALSVDIDSHLLVPIVPYPLYLCSIDRSLMSDHVRSRIPFLSVFYRFAECCSLHFLNAIQIHPQMVREK